MVGDINHIVVVQSLQNERETGWEIYNDVIKRNIEFRKSEITHRYFSAISRQEFIECMRYIQENCRYMPGGIVVHLEMHGNDTQSGLVLADKTVLSWKELIDVFRPINVITKNNLFVTLATCNGRNLYLGANDMEKSPYSCYISASSEVNPNQIVTQFSLLFEKLIETGNLVASYLEMENDGTKFYYKDSETTFEEAWKATAHKMRTDPSMKEEIEQHFRRVVGRELIMPYETMIEIVLKDAYAEHKRTFEF